uniref:Large ribosomal subunit protein uL22c n=5 Tax=Limonium TaxID=46093 RepID=A0A8A6C5C4_9CARY|nr:ribosomal protein L22 [Limonium tenellum]YP_009722541.1 ribosomal protein L22 [Limonium aureum]YP_010241399.1 ribosomal protein L22 [Limonium tetragonum]YP_010241482.1 ribosomal protein L22 [Limonium bicolor]YP_010997473.1 ribosomal protein L22 [Limonium franchetii]QKN99041.1 ribosomal protein L22 [Limonium sinense]QBC67892.1 ribosomal protein L22 [Limonium tenellum]QGN73766.1 ribosomal protein L22 [Limonium aureum]QTH79362.1 ribosomal protein L22 [Limonium tetragonum]QTH79445.1 ribosom
MRKKRKSPTEVSALGQYIPMSVDKARRVIDQIRGCSYEQTLMILELMPYRACYPILKLIYSAAANAKHNKGFEKEDLIVWKAEVNKGSIAKKLKPRARGRSYMIKRPTSHIKITLKDISYYKQIAKTFDNGEKYLRSNFRLKSSGVIWDKK